MKEYWIRLDQSKQMSHHITITDICLLMKIGLRNGCIYSRQRIQLSDFVPETIRLTNTTEKQKFVNEVYQGKS